MVAAVGCEHSLLSSQSHIFVEARLFCSIRAATLDVPWVCDDRRERDGLLCAVLRRIGDPICHMSGWYRRTPRPNENGYDDDDEPLVSSC